MHSFRSLISELGTLTMNTMQVSEDDDTFQLMTQPTALQQRCFEPTRRLAPAVATEGI